jgi:hypothetical protein
MVLFALEGSPGLCYIYTNRDMILLIIFCACTRRLLQTTIYRLLKITHYVACHQPVHRDDKIDFPATVSLGITAFLATH